mmetsp:Transcript_98184/g.278006  ORF Transcript_98184/g.278006 Transcript_98184/m.278006 type:complete len:260 (+) Transcript_98184:174-953(+)
MEKVDGVVHRKPHGHDEEDHIVDVQLPLQDGPEAQEQDYDAADVQQAEKGDVPVPGHQREGYEGHGEGHEDALDSLLHERVLQDLEKVHDAGLEVAGSGRVSRHEGLPVVVDAVAHVRRLEGALKGGVEGHVDVLQGPALEVDARVPLVLVGVPVHAPRLQDIETRFQEALEARGGHGGPEVVHRETAAGVQCVLLHLLHDAVPARLAEHVLRHHGSVDRVHGAGRRLALHQARLGGAPDRGIGVRRLAQGQDLILAVC